MACVHGKHEFERRRRMMSAHHRLLACDCAKGLSAKRTWLPSRVLASVLSAAINSWKQTVTGGQQNKAMDILTDCANACIAAGRACAP